MARAQSGQQSGRLRGRRKPGRRHWTKKWSVTVGLGEASPLLVGDKLYTFPPRQGGDEVTLCLDAANGQEVWKDKFTTAAVKGAASPFPGPRGTPAVGEGMVCTLGVNGVVSCLDAASGNVFWRKETKAKPQFYTSTSPMIADGKCIVYVDKLTAFDLTSGAVKWTYSGGGAPYGSPVLMTVEGTKQVVTPTAKNMLAGVSLADGKLLWEFKSGGGGYFGNYSTPLIDGQTVYYSATGGKGGKGGGPTNCRHLDRKERGHFRRQGNSGKRARRRRLPHPPLSRWPHRPRRVSTGKNFFCVDAKTGTELWKEHATRGECGSILDAGLVLLSLTSDSKLVAFRPSDKGYTEVAKYTVSSSPTWSVPIIAGNRIFVKDKGGSLTLWTIE